MVYFRRKLTIAFCVLVQISIDEEEFADVLDAIPETVTGKYAVDFRHLLSEIIKINEKKLRDDEQRKGVQLWQYDGYVEQAMAVATQTLLLPSSSKKEKREQMFRPPIVQTNIHELVSGSDNFSRLPGLRNGLAVLRRAPENMLAPVGAAELDEKDDSGASPTDPLCAESDEFLAARRNLLPFASTDATGRTHQLFDNPFTVPLEDVHHVFEFLSLASQTMQVDAHEVMSLSVPLCIELDASEIDFAMSDCVIAAHYFQQV